mmetsp:Transcript_31237/g.85765  ORF Transcript_31237/g.85765 Transcript_31237/m.85765 type:complete len:200 (-) Transcript_31237:386-985(-)
MHHGVVLPDVLPHDNRVLERSDVTPVESVTQGFLRRQRLLASMRSEQKTVLDAVRPPHQGDARLQLERAITMHCRGKGLLRLQRSEPRARRSEQLWIDAADNFSSVQRVLERAAARLIHGRTESCLGLHGDEASLRLEHKLFAGADHLLRLLDCVPQLHGVVAVEGCPEHYLNLAVREEAPRFFTHCVVNARMPRHTLL